MPSQMTLQDCIRLAEFAHFHQVDKAGFPYIEHPARVLAAVQEEGAPPYVQMAAILHDVTEDTPFTPDMLRTLGVPEAAVAIVELLDRGISRDKFYAQPHIFKHGAPEVRGTQEQIDAFYYAEIRKNSGAKQVKNCDIRDNTKPWRLVYLPEKQRSRLADKYTKALELLNGDVA